MLERPWLNLQLFGDGGDGGDGGSTGPVGESGVEKSGDRVPAFIPEKAKKYYQKAMAKTTASAPVSPTPSEPVQTTNESGATERPSYEDLIKSDDYKEEHKAYMTKAR